jgi:CheY-like chemotaxis protein
MSHEIRTPMNAIIGMSDLMRTDNLDGTQRGYFEDIKKMSKALLQIINDILDFSKIEAGKMELAEINFSLEEMFDNICSMSRFMAEMKELEFRYSYGPDVPRAVCGDESRVRQIIVNIINNAIKYTREGSVEFQVSRASKNGREYIAFVVKDTGIGMKKEFFPHLFDAFAQFDTRINRGIMGTGLGLPITKNLVSLMGGEIEVESEYGAGSAFTVLLPLAEGDPSLVEGAHFSSFTTFSDKARVLVVDDNTINLKVAVAYLARHNIKADTAAGGAEALQKVQGGRYDIVFMDHMMPGMDGVEAAKRIRAIGGGCEKIPIVALTANAVSGAREIFLAAGMNDFISKPIDPRILNAALVRWLPPDMARESAVREETAKTDTVGTAAGSVDIKAGLENAIGDEAFYSELATNFLMDHSSDRVRINEALEAQDHASARRIAHTLKSTAALIGARRLGNIAAEIERGLSGGGATAKIDLVELDGELKSVIAGLKTFLRRREAPVETRSAGPSDGNAQKELARRLAPLLKSGDTASLDFTDEIRAVFGGGMGELLARRIEDFDFPGAAGTLAVIERGMAR